MKPKHKNVINVERLKEILADLTLFDDIFMSQVFDNNIPAANLLLRVILGKKDIKVISVTGQKVKGNTIMWRYKEVQPVQMNAGQGFTAVC